MVKSNSEASKCIHICLQILNSRYLVMASHCIPYCYFLPSFSFNVYTSFEEISSCVNYSEQSVCYTWACLFTCFHIKLVLRNGFWKTAFVRFTECRPAKCNVPYPQFQGRCIRSLFYEFLCSQLVLMVICFTATCNRAAATVDIFEVLTCDI